MLVRVKKTDQEIVRLFDDQIVSQLYDEKILLFDEDLRLVYSSVGDTRLHYPEDALKRLKAGEKEISYSDEGYDVIAHKIDFKGKVYYALGKAFDEYGRKKLRFLGLILLATFILAVLLMFFLNEIISRKITTPVLRLISEVDQITANNLQRVHESDGHDEIARLSAEFNKMLSRVEKAFTYQKNLVHHISHELKTPISVLISNIERLEIEKSAPDQVFLEFQKAGLMQLADIINTLLEISRFEQISMKEIGTEIALFDLIFECAEEIRYIRTDTNVEMKMDENIRDASALLINGNERLLKIAFRNLVKNASDYSVSKNVIIQIFSDKTEIKVLFENDGPTLRSEEQSRLFIEYFRGNNSRLQVGFGLGLVMVYKILQLHKASIAYRINERGYNEFCVRFQRMSY